MRSMKAPIVLVLLEGLTCDGNVYKAGQRVTDPGPKLLAHAKPGAKHWMTGKRAAKLVGEAELESVSDQSLLALEELNPPPGSIVVLLEGLTADKTTYKLHQVVPEAEAGPKLRHWAQPGNKHWTGVQAAILRPREHHQMYPELQMSPEPTPETPAPPAEQVPEVTPEPEPVPEEPPAEQVETPAPPADPFAAFQKDEF